MRKIIYNLRENCKSENVFKENRAYDRLERFAETFAGFGSKVTYAYNSKGLLARQVIDGTPIDYEYTKHGFLAGKYLGGRNEPISSVVYEYSKSGRIVARSVNGKRTAYEYDGRNQLLAVKDSDGNDIERYSYDKAGNMLKKTVNGKTTTFTFDGANQLVSSTVDGVTTRYTYDAAGRLVKEGNKTYRYGYLDKVMSVSDGKQKLTYDYHADGQIASADYGNGKTEEFLWDGLALIRRNDEHFINEPHVGNAPKKLRFEGKPRAQRSARRARKGPRGNPVVSSKGVSYFNDMLGTTLGKKEKSGKYSAAALSAFGENLSNHSPTPTQDSNFFTGKPYIEGLGHTFLMRNYRASLAKWQTADPLGYPDGWNQLAYGVNSPLDRFDLFGGGWTTTDFVRYYYEPLKPRDIDTDDIGYTEAIWSVIASVINPRLNQQITYKVLSQLSDIAPISSGSGIFVYETDRAYANFVQVHWVLAGGRVQTHSIVNYSWHDEEREGILYRLYSITRDTFYYYSDSFSDPLAFDETVGIPFEIGFPYMYSHAWDKSYSWKGEYALE